MSKTKPDTWYVYILLCKNNALYTGITKDLEKCYKDHLNKTRRYTSYNPPKKIVYREKCKNRSIALKREIEIKRLSRKKKLELIQ